MIPFITFSYAIVTKADVVSFTVLMAMFLTWIPVVNPLMTIYFVKPYRNAVKSCFKGMTSFASSSDGGVRIHPGDDPVSHPDLSRRENIVQEPIPLQIV